MKGLLILACVAAVLALPLSLPSQTGRGGAGGTRAGVGAGGVRTGAGAVRAGSYSRPAANYAAPTFSRPPISRPMTVARPSAPHLGYVPPRPTTVSRPAAISRPTIAGGPISGGSLTFQRPTTPRPSISATPGVGVGAPTITRPSYRPATGTIAGATTRPPITRPSTLPSTVTSSRPSFERPPITVRPTLPSRPEIARPIRPGGTGVAIQPSLGLGYRTIPRDLSHFNTSYWNKYGRSPYYHRPWYSGYPGYRNMYWYANRPAWYWNRPWYNYHWHWHHGYWNYWLTPPAFWVYSGLWAAANLWPGATYAYYNPYYVPSTTVYVQPVLDYSVPIPTPVADQAPLAYPPAPDQQILESGAALPTTPPPEPDTSDPNIVAANRDFESARTAFKSGNYAQAQAVVDKAIEKLPSDATLHEFRALTLFAQGRYKEAAATLYAVLSAGPGWDWQTMVNLYPDENVYTQQLRALELFVRNNSDAAEGHFDLAYQYLVLGHKAEAVRQLKRVVELQPDDKLSAALLKALTTESATSVPVPEPAPPAKR